MLHTCRPCSLYCAASVIVPCVHCCPLSTLCSITFTSARFQLLCCSRAFVFLMQIMSSLQFVAFEDVPLALREALNLTR